LENDAVKYGKATPLEYYLKASEGGFVPADAAIGDIYYEAQGKDRKLDEAVAHYKKALEANQLRGKSAKRYAQCVQEGYGGETPNKERANQIRGLASKDRWEDVLSTSYLNVK
jgi:TPR repeat protein